MGRDDRQRLPSPEGASTAAYDRFGRRIQTGDLLILLNQGTILWRVKGTAPVLSPQAPPGMVAVQLVAIFEQGVQGGAPIPDFVVARSVEPDAKAPRVAAES